MVAGLRTTGIRVVLKGGGEVDVNDLERMSRLTEITGLLLRIELLPQLFSICSREFLV